MATYRNPFLRPNLGPHVQSFAAADRIEDVKSFDARQCRAALKLPGLQATVRQAVERRQRQLSNGKGKLFVIFLIMGLMGCGGGGAGSGGTSNLPAPSESLVYANESLLTVPGGEGTPVVFNGKILVVMGVRVGVPVQRIQIADGISRVLLADFQAPQGITLICAIVNSGRLYIFGVTDFNMSAGLATYGNRIVMTSTDDLVNWTSQTVYNFPENIAGYNLSVAPTPAGFIMAYDFGPPWQQGFLTSPDLVHWTSIPGHFQAPPWSSAVTVRYLNGYYYLFYSTQDNVDKYYTGAVRSTDLLSWQPATKAVIYPTTPLDHINTTDFDLVEVGDQVFAAYAIGDQSGNGAMTTAIYAGTFEQMVTELFQ